MALQIFQGGRYPSTPELTFGLEFEFLGHVDATKLSEEEKRALATYEQVIPRDIVRLVAEAVKEQLDVLGLHHPVDITNWLEILGPSAIVNEHDYTSWMLKTDQSVMSKDRNFSSYAGLELTTPIMSNQTSSLDECVRVAEALVAYRPVSFNDTCGLHVHVGHGNKGFSLLTCQKLFTLLFLGGEEILNTLVRADRRSNLECLDITKWSAVISQEIIPPTGSLPQEWFSRCFPPGSRAISDLHSKGLTLIWKAANINEFARCVHGGSLGYCWEHLTTTSSNPTGTIEFRKAEGDLGRPMNVHFVYDWPQVCLGLVAFAVDADPAEFERVLKKVGAALRAPTKKEQVRTFLDGLGFNQGVVMRLAERAEALA